MRMHKILLIVHSGSENIGTICEHIYSLEKIVKGDVYKIDSRAAAFVDFKYFDVIILHYSLVISSENYISHQLAEKLSNFDRLCILFIQDEYRWIDRTVEAMERLSVDVVFSLISPDVVRKVYHHPYCDKIRFEHTLTGFVPDQLANMPVPDYEDRALDVGYRARKLASWYGSYTHQKWQIAEKFAADARNYNLNVDISTSEDDRIYGDAWIEFIAGSKACLGTESGASVCDFTGEIQKNVEEHLKNDPNASFEKLRDLYFSGVDGKIVMNVISPRCFEAACLRTLLIMFPEDYAGILKPGRHYVLLQPDHSNIDEVIEVLRSPVRAKKIISAAYNEIVLSGRWSYDAFAGHVDKVIAEEAGKYKPSTEEHTNLADHISQAHKDYEEYLRLEILHRHKDAWIIRLAIFVDRFVDDHFSGRTRDVTKNILRAAYGLYKRGAKFITFGS